MTASRDRAPSVRAWVVVYLKGVAMGAADAIPGISGGTIALIVGIYERLVDAVAGLSARGPDALVAVAADRGPRLSRLRRSIVDLDLHFLAVLGIGVLTGVVAVANLVDLALGTYRAETFAFFFGVIVASPAVLRDEVGTAPRPLAAGLLGAVLAFWLSGLPRGPAVGGLPALFAIGAVAISAMVLPGISGSLMLLVLGAYRTMTGAVSELTRGVLDGASVDALLDPLLVLVVFAAGALVGLLTVTRLVSWAIDAHRVPTMTFLVGIMFGSLRSPAGEIAASVDALTIPVAGGLLVAGGIGAAAVVALSRVGHRDAGASPDRET